MCGGGGGAASRLCFSFFVSNVSCVCLIVVLVECFQYKYIYYAQIKSTPSFIVLAAYNDSISGSVSRIKPVPTRTMAAGCVSRLEHTIFCVEPGIETHPLSGSRLEQIIC